MAEDEPEVCPTCEKDYPGITGMLKGHALFCQERWHDTRMPVSEAWRDMREERLDRGMEKLHSYAEKHADTGFKLSVSFTLGRWNAHVEHIDKYGSRVINKTTRDRELGDALLRLLNELGAL